MKIGIKGVLAFFIISATVSYIAALYYQNGGLVLLSLTFLIPAVYIEYLDSPKWFLTMLCVVTLFISLILAVLYQNTDYSTAGFTLILVFITAWYASSAEKQFRIAEKSQKGKFVAEISRSIFSPMQLGLKVASERLRQGTFLSLEEGMKLQLSNEPSPHLFLNDNISIVPRNQSVQITGSIERPAKSLLKIQKDEIVLQTHLPGIEKLGADYDRYWGELQKYYIGIYEKIPTVAPDIKTKLLKSKNFENLLNLTRKVIEYDQKVVVHLIFDNIADKKFYTEQDFYVFYYRADQEGAIDLPAKAEWIKQYEKFVRENREDTIHLLLESSISEDVKNILDTQSKLSDTIQKLIVAIDDLFLDWKLEYYLVEDELQRMDFGFI
jgi:hypothetical protein